MPAAYWVSVTVHVFAAMFWLGGMFFLGVVGAPVLRAVEPPPLRQRLFNELGRRFRTAGWIAIAALIASGIVNLHYRGFLRASVLGDGAFWATGIGHALAWKLAAVSFMVVNSAFHDFVLGPAAGRADPLSAEGRRLRQRAAWLARANGLVGLILLVAAVRVARA